MDYGIPFSRPLDKVDFKECREFNLFDFNPSSHFNPSSNNSTPEFESFQIPRGLVRVQFILVDDRMKGLPSLS